MPSPTFSPPKSILLLGAGELGTAILTSLAAHPALHSTKFTLLLRPFSLANPSRLASLRALLPPARDPSTLSFAAIDLSAPDAQADLSALIASAPHDLVISCTGMDASGTDAGRQLLIARAVLDAGAALAKATGTAPSLRFFPWQFGLDYDAIPPHAAGGLMREQHAVRTLLRTQSARAGVDWTIVSTGLFMSFLFEEAFGVVQGLGAALRAGGPEPLGDEGAAEVVVRALGGDWEKRLSVTDVRDIGAVVAEVVAAPVTEGEGKRDDGGRVVFVAGETVAYGEVAEVVRRVVGRRRAIGMEEWGVEFLREELEREPESQMRKYRLLFAEGRGVSWDMAETINVKRGIETVGVERWLREKLSM